MKPRFFWITTLVAFFGSLLVSGCHETTTPPSSARNTMIVPQASPGIVLAREEASSVSIQLEEETITPKADLPEDVLFFSALDANLDIDEPEEQIVIVKRSDDPEDRVRILVTDFDSLRNSYRVTWEGVSLATNVRTFSIYTSDLLGDHVEEIVGIGTDRQGRQTMDVFRRRQGLGMTSGIQYENVFSVATDGSIEIGSRPRSDSYRTLQSNGISFPIDVYRQNRETETSLDLIKTRWSWNVAEGRYLQTTVEPIPAVQIEEEQLRGLYDAESDVVESFIQGPWFRSEGESMGPDLELAYFDPEDREVVLFHDDRQERYEWLNSYKTLYASGPGLWMNLRNDVLSTVRRQLSVTVLGVDSIVLSVEGAEYWNGRYRRMTPGIQSGILKKYDLESPSFVLDGVYINENDTELLFNRPFFRFRTDRFDWSGGYNLISINDAILELKVLEYDRAPEGVVIHEDESFTVRYRITYQEQQSEGGQIRRLQLRPVQITVDGLVPTAGEEFVLEQVIERTDR